MSVNVMELYVSHVGLADPNLATRVYNRALRYGRLYAYDCKDLTRKELRDALLDHLEHVGGEEVARFGGVGLLKVVEEVVKVIGGEVAGVFIEDKEVRGRGSRGEWERVESRERVGEAGVPVAPVAPVVPVAAGPAGPDVRVLRRRRAAG